MNEDEPTKRHHKDNSATVALRIAKCILACDGIDDYMLDILAIKDGEMTNLQKLVNRVDISGAYRAINIDTNIR